MFKNASFFNTLYFKNENFDFVKRHTQNGVECQMKNQTVRSCDTVLLYMQICQAYVWLLLIVGWLLPNLVMVVSYISIIRANRSPHIFLSHQISLLNPNSAFLNIIIHCFYTVPTVSILYVLQYYRWSSLRVTTVIFLISWQRRHTFFAQYFHFSNFDCFLNFFNGNCFFSTKRLQI